MSLESWDPATNGASNQTLPDSATLSRLIKYSLDGQLEALATAMAVDEQRRFSGLMAIEHPLWQQRAESLSDEELRHLIRFFAVAENLPGWEAQEKSPVIPLAKALRKRGVRLDKALLKWLRSVNNNRYLPYGPL